MVKDGRFSYFADLISSSKCNCKVLFNTINNIASPAPPDVTVILNMDCNNFLSFFADNIKDTGASIAPSSTPLYDNPTQPSILDSHFSAGSHWPWGSVKLSPSPVDILQRSMLRTDMVLWSL